MAELRKLRDWVGIIKDKASQSKAALLSRRRATVSFHLAVLRATTHSPAIPPSDRHLSALISLGDTSRSTAFAVVDSLMDRLHRTRNPSVAVKCLLAIHHIVRRGPFILLDQLSFFPATGGHNYLKLSSFTDRSTTTAWALSAWVRWYARYLETLLSNFRVLGFFLSSSSYCPAATIKQKDTVLSMSNADLINDLNSLVGVIEEICKLPDSIEGNKLLYEVKILVGYDHLSTVNKILPRLGEYKERLSSASFVESIEFQCVLKRIEDCKERVSEMFIIKKPSVRKLWALTGELKGEAALFDAYIGKLLTLPEPEGGRGGGTEGESARYENRVMKFGESGMLG